MAKKVLQKPDSQRIISRTNGLVIDANPFTMTIVQQDNGRHAAIKSEFVTSLNQTTELSKKDAKIAELEAKLAELDTPVKSSKKAKPVENVEAI